MPSFSQTQTHRSIAIDPEAITIIRDTWGVPHIYAPTDAAGAYGLAWAQAEDDFATVQEALLAGKQMLARVQGRDGALFDYFSRWVRARQQVERQYDTLSRQFRRILAASAKAYNAYAAAHPDEVLVDDALPITGQDIMVTYVLEHAFIGGFGSVVRDLVNEEVPPAQTGLGSNAFAFSSGVTATDETFLAINSHQPLTGPFSWYEAHIHTEEGWHMYGGTFPGAVTFFMGVNEHLGWAHTTNGPDNIDVYELKINPANKNQYRYNGEWVDFERDQVKLKVNLFWFLNWPVKREVLWCKYGPAMRVGERVFALRHAGLFDIRSAEQWYRMNKASNLAEFKAAMDMEAIMRLNTLYADRKDNLYMLSGGLIPKQRNPRYDWSQTLPGDTSATRWPPQFYSYDSLPQIENPNCGYIYNCNNPPFFGTCAAEAPEPARYPKRTMGYYRKQNSRGKRFEQLWAQQQGKLTWQDFLRIKYDQQLPPNSTFLQSLEDKLALDAQEYPELEGVLEVFQDWDHSFRSRSRSAGLMMVFMIRLMKQEHLGTEVFRHGLQLEEERLVEALRYAKKHMLKHFGRLDPRYGQVMRHRRGDKDLALWGFPDVMGAMLGKFEADGRLKGRRGESHIILARLSEEGVQLRAVNEYGTSNKPGSPHYSDQMELFANQETRPVTMKREALERNAERIYHPGESAPAE